MISCIAKLDVPQGQWNDLLQFLYTCCQSPQSSHREVGFFVIFTLLDVVAESLTQHLHHLLQMFEQGLSDPESRDVKMTTLKALGRLAELIEPEDETSIVSSSSRVAIYKSCDVENFPQADPIHGRHLAAFLASER